MLWGKQIPNFPYNEGKVKLELTQLLWWPNISLQWNSNLQLRPRFSEVIEALLQVWAEVSWSRLLLICGFAERLHVSRFISNHLKSLRTVLLTTTQNFIQEFQTRFIDLTLNTSSLLDYDVIFNNRYLELTPIMLHCQVPNTQYFHNFQLQ